MSNHKLAHLTNEFDHCEKCKLHCWRSLETFQQSAFKHYDNYDINVRKNELVVRYKRSKHSTTELYIIPCNVSDEDYLVKEIIQ